MPVRHWSGEGDAAQACSLERSFLVPFVTFPLPFALLQPPLAPFLNPPPRRWWAVTGQTALASGLFVKKKKMEPEPLMSTNPRLEQHLFPLLWWPWNFFWTARCHLGQCCLGGAGRPNSKRARMFSDSAFEIHFFFFFKVFPSLISNLLHWLFVACVCLKGRGIKTIEEPPWSENLILRFEKSSLQDFLKRQIPVMKWMGVGSI